MDKQKQNKPEGGAEKLREKRLEADAAKCFKITSSSYHLVWVISALWAWRHWEQREQPSETRSTVSQGLAAEAVRQGAGLQIWEIICSGGWMIYAYMRIRMTSEPI